MIYITNLSKVYSTKYCKVNALKNINLTLPDRGLIFITGKSGSGKSTLLNLLGGLDSATSGSILFNGVDVAKMKGRALDDYRRNSVGFVFQEFNLIKEYNIYDNIAVTLNLSGERDNAERVSNALKTVELEGYEKRHVDELSGGQKQRVSIARALSTETDILLADEPTGNLDSVTAQEIFDILKKISEDKLVVVVTHDKESANKYGDRIIELKDGKIISDNEKEIENNVVEEITAEEKSVSEEEEKRPNKTKRMSLAYLTRLAFINIWKKKIRLVVTMLLFTCMLTLFGFSLGIYSMDEATVASKAVADIGIREMPLTYYDEEGIHIFTDKMITDLNNGFDAVRFDKIYQTKRKNGQKYYDFSYYFIDDDDVYRSIMFNTDGNHVEVNEELIKERGYTINGRLPNSHLEIAISKYYADRIIDDESLEGYVKNYSDILNKQFILNSPAGSYKIRITGIIDTGADEYYDLLIKNLKSDCIRNKEEVDRIYNDDIVFTLANCIFVSKKFMECHKAYIKNEQYDKQYESYLSEMVIEGVDGVITFIDKCPLNNTEIILSERLVHDCAYKEGYFEIEEPLNKGLLYYNISGIPYKIVGYFTEEAEKDTPLNYSTCIVSNDSNLLIPPFDVTAVNVLLSGDANKDRAFFWYMFGDEETKDIYGVRSIVNRDIPNLWFMEFYRKIAYYATIVFGIFSVVMMLNFIITSINSNKREIGILRALGMRMSGIFYIFIMEALIVCLVAFILSIALVFVLVSWWNANAMGVVYILPFEYVGIGAVEIFSMLGLSLGIALISSLIPILIKARIMPIDIMRKY